MSNLSKDQSVVLIGFMGAGKSTVASLLSSRLEWPCLDLDRLIVDRTGLSIPEIFARQGEAAFRLHESEALTSLAAAGPFVLATGGGVVTQEGNWPILQALGRVVYLRASMEKLIERIDAGEGRPLAAQGAARLRELFEQRASLYERADWILDTDDVEPGMVADSIYRRIIKDC